MGQDCFSVLLYMMHSNNIHCTSLHNHSSPMSCTFSTGWVKVHYYTRRSTWFDLMDSTNATENTYQVSHCHDLTLLNKSVYCVTLNKPVCCKLVLCVLLLMCSLVLPVCMLVLTTAWWLRFLYLRMLALVLLGNNLWMLLRWRTVLEVVTTQLGDEGGIPDTRGWSTYSCWAAPNPLRRAKMTRASMWSELNSSLSAICLGYDEIVSA